MERIVAAAAPCIAATSALAHLNPARHRSFAAGLSHPVCGLDHVLTMVAIGLRAAVLGIRAIWALPLSSVGLVMFGFATAITGLALLFVEPMIHFSVLALGPAVALAPRLPVSEAAGIVEVLVLFHGQVHGGGELGSAGVLVFGAGFAVSTMLLHAVGIGLSLAAGRAIAGSRILQWFGWSPPFGGFGTIVGRWEIILSRRVDRLFRSQQLPSATTAP